jgi:hypothetical protein
VTFWSEGTHFGAERFTRDQRRISSDGIDHYMVQLYYAGALVGSTKRNEMKVRPGDIQILDLAQPHRSTVLNSATVVIMVRRDLMMELVPTRADLHGVILRGDGGAGGLLADYMRSLFARLPTVDRTEAPFIARATAQMIAACFNPTAATTSRARAQIEGTVTDRLKTYIDANLRSSDLSPDDLCRRFRISRTQLYRLFEPLGESRVTSRFAGWTAPSRCCAIRSTGTGPCTRLPSRWDSPASLTSAEHFAGNSDSVQLNSGPLSARRPS